MQYSDFDDSEGFNRAFSLRSDFNSGDEDDFGDHAMETLRVPKPQLRSRPPIDFPGRRSTVGHLPSHMSGSTLRSIPNSSMFPRKASSHIGSSSHLSFEAIESLTESELSLNPLHRKLHQKYDHVSEVLATYLERDLAESRVAKSNALVPDVHQGA
jgi:hypothetical protein